MKIASELTLTCTGKDDSVLKQSETWEGLLDIMNTHMVQKCAVLSGPPYLHHARCDYFCLIVPHTRVHLECASHTFKGVGITPRLKYEQTIVLTLWMVIVMRWQNESYTVYRYGILYPVSRKTKHTKHRLCLRKKKIHLQLVPRNSCSSAIFTRCSQWFFFNSFIVQRLFTLVQKQGFQNCSLNQCG